MNIRFKFLNPSGALTRVDTKVGTVYEGTLCLTEAAIRFIDDVGETVKVFLSNHKIEQIPDAPVSKRQYTKVSSGKRQFDIKFKRKAVKGLQKIREIGVHGDVKRYFQTIGVGPAQVYHWEKQLSSGILKKLNAVSFSTNPSAMIRG